MSSLFESMVNCYQNPAEMVKKAADEGEKHADKLITKEAEVVAPVIEGDTLQEKIASMLSQIDESVKRDSDDNQPEVVKVAEEDAVVKLAELIATDKAVETVAAKPEVEAPVKVAAVVAETVEPKTMSSFGDAYEKMDFSKLAEQSIDMEKVGSIKGMIGSGIGGGLMAGGATYLGMKSRQNNMANNFNEYVQLDKQRDSQMLQKAYRFGQASAQATPKGGTL